MNRFQFNSAPLGGGVILGVVQAPAGIAADLIAAFVLECSDGSLADDFEETDPEWEPKFTRGRGSGVDPPYAEVTEIDGPSAFYDSGGGFGGSTEIQVSIFAETRGEAVELSNKMVTYFKTHSLKWEGGSAAGMFHINPFQGVFEDPFPWRDGKRLWSKIVRFRVVMGGR